MDEFDEIVGLQRGTVKLSPYNSQWRELFEKEKALLLSEFRDTILAIEHVGSTAIPGVPAKPIIDINIAVVSLDSIDIFIERLPQLGYEYIQERKYPDRQFFPKGTDTKRTHHLNLVEIDSDTGWINYILFRDYLRNNPEAKEKYIQLKMKLADKHADNREEYTEGKAEFIRNIINKAKDLYGISHT